MTDTNSNHDGRPVQGGDPGGNGTGPITFLVILNDERDRFSTRTAIDGLPGVELVGERTELRSGLLLARQLRPRILLLDLPETCDEAPIADVARAPRIDSPTVHMNLLHHRTGTAVLAQPEDMNKVEVVTPAQAGGMIDALSSSFDVVVIDTPHTLDEVSLELFDRSTSILIALELSVLGIRAARRA